MAVRAHLFKIDGRVLGGMQFGGAGAGAVLGVTVFLHLDGRVHGGMQFGQGHAVWGAAAGAVLGCCLGCCWRC